MAKKARGKRTRKGTVTAAARRKHGMKGKGSKGKKFPVFDARSARSALKLRGRGKGVSRSAVIAKVSRFASKTKNKSLKAAVKRARAADRKK